MFFTKSKPIPVNLQLGLETVLYLVNNNKLPITNKMLEDFGKWEGLPSETILSVLNLKNGGLLNMNSVPKDWCLEKIVLILIKENSIIDENMYKKLVNVVNELGLSFTFLDKTIRKSKISLKA